MSKTKYKNRYNKITARRKDPSRYESLGTVYGSNNNYLSNYSSGGYKVKVPDTELEYNGISGYLHDNIY